MDGEFTVTHLRCGHCGSELPVMGRYVTFQCETCFKYWIISPEGLEPLQVYRAETPEETGGEILLLPFWVVPLDGGRLRENVEESMTLLREFATTVAGTEFTVESGEFEQFADEITGTDSALNRASLLSEITHTRTVPSGGELDNILRRIEENGAYNIFVPAFQSANTFAYLKIGRLLTRRQPRFSAARHENPGQPVMCVLPPEEAVHLMDFVFIATLPESIQRNGEFLENIHLEPSASPRLVELPFSRKGAALTSIYGNFEISSKLVEP